MYRAAPEINRLRVVIAASDEPYYTAAVEGLDLPAPIEGGFSRQQSVLKGLEAIAADAPDFVAIHDAARPFVRPVDIANCLKAAAGGRHRRRPYWAYRSPTRSSARMAQPW